MSEPTSTESRRSPAPLLGAGLVGNILEWYDFSVYGFFAVTIGTVFFPSGDPTVSLIASFGAFAAGFLMRPVGSVMFGYIGDRLGRKKMLTLSIALMAVPTFLIGLMPGHAQIGVAASVGMVVMRMLQGLSVGGEYTGSIVFLTESAPPGRKGFFSSFSLVGANVGVLLGSGVGALVTSLTTAEQLASWGWRIPFLGGIVISLIGVYLRRHVDDVPLPETRSRSPLGETLRDHKKPLVQGFCLNMLFAVVFYLLFIYVSTWLNQEVGLSKARALDINTIALLVLSLVLPFLSRLSDRVGRRPILLAGSGAMALLGYPLIWLMHHDDLGMILAGQVIFALLLGIYISVIPVTLTELFPRKVRASAVSVAYNLPFALFGGTAPMVATWLIARTGDALVIGWYAVGVAVLAFVVALGLEEPSTSEPGRS